MEHDTLAKRLGLILTRLNTGERLTLANLSMEFNVTQRTLQRDFNERLNYLPIEREGSTYFIDVKYLGRQGKQDIKPILEMLGLSSIFPSFDALSFTRLNDNQVAPFLFRELKIEDVSSYEETFKLLTSAIQNNQIIRFCYKQKTYRDVSPYRLVNDRGWWYLAAIHNDTLKSYKVAQVSKVDVASQHFKRRKEVDDHVIDGSMIWLTDSPIEVVLRIDSSIASHFRNTNILPEQKLLKILDDDSLLVTSTITNQKQIIPILKYWLPDIEILSPVELKQSLVYELQFSIDQLSR
jgi:predicted DNA-binding transcriptional regulator YafY